MSAENLDRASMEDFRNMAAALVRAEALAGELEADQSMILAPGWMVRDAVVAKLRAALRGDDATTTGSM